MSLQSSAQLYPELEIPFTWRQVSQVLTTLDVPYPKPETPVSELKAWVDWWWPVFQAAQGITPDLVIGMKATGWWPPHVPRSGQAPSVVAEATSGGQVYWFTRRRIDDRSRAYHRAVAEQLQANPELIGQARMQAAQGADEHRRAGVGDSPCLHWKRILEYPIEHLVETLSYDSERMDYLRQYSPFRGIMTAETRLMILQAFAVPTRAELLESDSRCLMQTRQCFGYKMS